MEITSPVFNGGDFIPSKYTCDGKNINPPLDISDVPSEALSLVLIMDDPDSPGKEWVHWLVWNIDPSTKTIPEGTTPYDSVQGFTSFNNNIYGGPCPNQGTHRYYFKLYALNKSLDIPLDTDKEELLPEMEDFILEEASLMGLYKRK